MIREESRMRERVLLVAVLVCFFAVPLLAEDPVHFANETLKTAVEDALWVWDPTPADMLGLTSLTVGSEKIDSVVGLEYATNLTTLELPCNWITDIAPLSTLVNLKRLVLNKNEITDLTPLADMTQLEYLDVHFNRSIRDVTPLGGLLDLHTLVIRNNSLTDITPLSNLTELQELYLQYNNISDISPLTTLTNLTHLTLGDNPLNDEAYDLHLPQILANNPGLNISYPASPSQFMLGSTTGGSIVSPGEGEFNYSGIASISIEAQADPGFVFLRFEGSVFTTKNPVTVRVDQDHNIVACFLSLSDTLYVDDDAIDDPGPADISVSDPLEEGTVNHPFDSIQEAIDVAAEGTSVIVGPGLYREPLSFTGRAVNVLGIDPNDPNVAGFPVIDAGREGTAVSFKRGEDPNCLMSGFIVSGGRGQRAGAILCSGSSPTISNCVIVGNRSMSTGGAILCCTDSEAAFVNCTIAGNYSGDDGVGLRLTNSRITLWNSILWDDGISLDDETSVLSMGYTDTPQSWEGAGNIQSDPLFVQPGHWMDAESGLPAEPNDSKAIWVLGDYHLKSRAGRWDPVTETWIQDEITSPCIDAGDPNCPIGNEPNPNGQITNMGAYGQTAQAALSDTGV